jgi:hypothetical protein
MFDKNYKNYPLNTLPTFMFLYAKHDMLQDIYTLNAEDIDKYHKYLENCVEFNENLIASSKIFEKKPFNLLDIFSKEINPNLIVNKDNVIIGIGGESFLSKYETTAIFYTDRNSYNISQYLTKKVVINKIKMEHNYDYGYYIKLQIHADSLKINEL